MINCIELFLPPRNSLREHLTLLSTFEWPGIERVVINRRVWWVYFLFTAMEIDFDPRQLHCDPLSGRSLVFLKNGVAFFFNEAPEDSWVWLACFEF